ncbi:PAS domain-containing protein [Pararobbsia alpina]|uniref:PAC domain-containing protein n=1 Tax=Pararobbsia alpina TaxID=621374 RepID=A0A6S7BHL6_9BURK|nr:PAS domain-containing protein [Pararobbsia alpina]CAB3800668.1 hypothetical protein LMG28138_04888 [Pararobbsia alpina]
MQARDFHLDARPLLDAFQLHLGENSPGICVGLVELLPEAVYCCDPTGRITVYNSAASDLWGRAPGPGKAIFCGSFKLLFADGTPLNHDKCPTCLALRRGRDVGSVEAMLERPDGTRRNIVMHPRLVRDRDGRVVGAVNVLIDLTERKKLESKLAGESQRKDEFLALLAQSFAIRLHPSVLQSNCSTGGRMPRKR